MKVLCLMTLLVLVTGCGTKGRFEPQYTCPRETAVQANATAAPADLKADDAAESEEGDDGETKVIGDDPEPDESPADKENREWAIEAHESSLWGYVPAPCKPREDTDMDQHRAGSDEGKVYNIGDGPVDFQYYGGYVSGSLAGADEGEAVTWKKF